MKIIQIIQKPQLRGAELFACQLANALCVKGIEVILISLFKGDAVLPFDGRQIQLNLSPHKRFFDWRGWKELARIIALEAPDIIQANAGDTLKYAVISRFIFGWKGVLIFRNASTVSLYIKSKGTRFLNALMYARIDHIISVSHFTGKDLVSLFPWVGTRLSVIPIGLTPCNTMMQERPTDQIILLHIGGFTFEKNHEGLIRIFESFKERHPNSLLWLVGDGPLRNSVERYVESKKLQKSVKFWGYQQEPLSFLKACDVFLLPSIIEGLPAVILEAFYCKAPVVAYHVGGIPELVKADETGLLIKKGNEIEFGRAIIEVINDKVMRMSLVEHAYDLVTHNYLIDHVSGQFLDLYKKLRR